MRLLLPFVLAVLLGSAWPVEAATAMAMAMASPLIPAPLSTKAGQGQFTLTNRTPVVVLSDDPEAVRTARYFAAELAKARGPQLQVRTAGAASPRSIVFELNPDAAIATEEGYTLDVKPSAVRVSARHPHGLFNGAISLLQLAMAGRHIPCQHIDDQPRFAWRGLMLDSARHMQSPEEIKRFLDAMALHKLDIFQWHLTDDQGWRLQIRKYPHLTEVGAWRIPAGAAGIDATTGKPVYYGGYYTQDQVREIVRYAAERYITIVPEIDMPGHAQAAIAAYPELGTVPAPAVSHDWGVHNYLFNADESTYRFLEDVLTEVIELFPGPYIHIGGDEVVTDQWKDSKSVQLRMHELGVPNEKALQAYLTARMQRLLATHGRRLVGWDEILEGELPGDAVVMSWRGVDGALAATKQGHDSVLSPWPTLYFDNRQGTSADEPPGRLRTISLEDVYRFDPVPASMTADQSKHVLGVQGAIWTEHIRTFDRVQWMTFPRAAAIAELGWSAPAHLNWSDFQRRLPALYGDYDALGILHAHRKYTSAHPIAVATNTSRRRTSAELKLCSDAIALGLEDDAPARGPRAIFHLDIQNPCWLFEQADLDKVSEVVAAVGSVPFNFQIGDAAAKIKFAEPITPEGELVVMLDRCDGEVIARLPLAPAAASAGVTVLPIASLPHRSGRHDLCLKFAQRGLDPMYALDWIELHDASNPGGK